MNFEASLQSGDQTAVVHRGVVMVMVMMVGIVTVMERRRRSMIYDYDVDDIMVPWYRSVWLCVANQCNVIQEQNHPGLTLPIIMKEMVMVVMIMLLMMTTMMMMM